MVKDLWVGTIITQNLVLRCRITAIIRRYFTPISTIFVANRRCFTNPKSVVFILKADIMKKTCKSKISPQHQRRLDYIAQMLKEMRFSEGKKQDGFLDFGVSRRQIQRGESGCNISLVRLFNLIDCYDGYSLSDFFEGME